MEITKQDIQILLNQTNSIVQKYNEIADISGERFNVFSIIGLQSNETRLHSKLINELLNPKGKHGQKDLFLKLFIDVVNETIDRNIESINYQESNNKSLNKILNFKTESASSGIEIHAGKVNIDQTEGGRIDILIKDNQGYGIIIENKIWAGEQNNQLLRYHNFGNIKFKTFQTIYLTVDGKDSSTGGDELNYVCISYKEEILKWLELCRKECSQLPIIRETITQYINQLKIYSGQSINHKMKDEIIKTMSENIDGAFEIANNISMLQKHLMKKLKQEIELVFKTKLINSDFQFEFQDGFTTGNKWKGLSIYKKKWSEKNMVIRFSFEKDNFNELIYGFARQNPKMGDGLVNVNIRQQLIKKEIPNVQHTEVWPLHFRFEPNNWEKNKTVWIEIQNGKMIGKFEEAIDILLGITDELNL